MADQDCERERGYQQGSQALQRFTAQGVLGSSGIARSPESPTSPGDECRAGDGQAGTERRAGAASVHLDEPWPPEPEAPAPLLGLPGRADKPRRLRSLQGALCLQISGGEFVQTFRSWRTAGGAAGPGSPGAQVVAPGFSALASLDREGAPGGRRCVCVFVDKLAVVN